MCIDLFGLRDGSLARGWWFIPDIAGHDRLTSEAASMLTSFPLWPDPDYPQQLAPTARTRLGKIWPPGAGTFARIIDERLALAPPSGAITPRRVGGGTGRPRENAHGAVLAQDGAALRPGLVGHGWGVPLAGACVVDG